MDFSEAPPGSWDWPPQLNLPSDFALPQEMTSTAPAEEHFPNPLYKPVEPPVQCVLPQSIQNMNLPQPVQEAVQSAATGLQDMKAPMSQEDAAGFAAMLEQKLTAFAHQQMRCHTEMQQLRQQVTPAPFSTPKLKTPDGPPIVYGPAPPGAEVSVSVNSSPARFHGKDNVSHPYKHPLASHGTAHGHSPATQPMAIGISTPIRCQPAEIQHQCLPRKQTTTPQEAQVSCSWTSKLLWR